MFRLKMVRILLQNVYSIDNMLSLQPIYFLGSND